MKLKFAILSIFLFCYAGCGDGLELSSQIDPNDAYISGEIKKYPDDLFVVKDPEVVFEKDDMCWLGDVDLCLELCMELKRLQMSLGIPPQNAHWCDVFLANHDR